MKGSSGRAEHNLAQIPGERGFLSRTKIAPQEQKSGGPSRLRASKPPHSKKRAALGGAGPLGFVRTCFLVEGEVDSRRAVGVCPGCCYGKVVGPGYRDIQ